MGSTRIIVLAAAAGLLSACSATLDRAQVSTPPEDEFARALHAGYLEMARSEISENDFADAEVFAQRALHAANGEPTLPESLGARRLPQAQVPALADARTRLIEALNKGAREKAPLAAAGAQTAFDCWIQEQEENIQPHEIAACRQAFLTAFKKIGANPLAAASPVRPKPVPAALRRPAPSTALKTRFVIYFDFDTAHLAPESEAKITMAAQAARRVGAAMVRITGHADRSGSERHNLALSRQRAQRVAAAIRRLGLPEMGVATLAYGEEKPAVPTTDGVREPRNRRVEIELNH